MKFAALVSGGKDSCFNMMSCIAEGHEIVALANLRPESKDELDSYMYQTVGHHAIDLYAEAMDLPLYVGTIKGSSLSIGRDYQPLVGDEVEDLFHLLSQVKAEKDIEAVSVGAILSDYQRVRVENVCQRLGLKVLAFLWRRNQEELLKEMIACNLRAIIIKVAALGLLPEKHLGMELKEIFPHMLKMKQKFGLNECGEGGEYETFVFDCPLFKKSIVIEERELVIHSNDAFAPVGYLNLKKCHLKDKPQVDAVSLVETVEKLPLMNTSKWLACHLPHGENDAISIVPSTSTHASLCSAVSFDESEIENGLEPEFAFDGIKFRVAGVKAYLYPCPDISQATETALWWLKDHIESHGYDMSDISSISLYVQSMSHYALINASYIHFFGINPPVRICIQVCLPPKVLFMLDCQGSKVDELNPENDRRTMHVQSLSHWAPANIGPFSQAVMSAGEIHVAGTIGLIPSNLNLIHGGIAVQSKVALIHVVKKLEAMWPKCTVAHCPLVYCYVTKKEYIPVAKSTFGLLLQEAKNTMSGSVSLDPIVQCCVVPGLPKGACVEWQAYAWMFEDSDEDNIHGLQFGKTFPLYSLDITCTHFKDHFSCRIEACFTSSSGSNVDLKALASDMLREHSTIVETQGSSDLKKGLVKIFYPAGTFSEKDLVESFTETLPGVTTDFLLPTFSFIPVINLERESHLLVWCQ